MTDAIQSWMRQLLEPMAPANRRSTLAGMARRVRQAQGRRIATQTDPDGAPYPPRRPRAGIASRAAMFRVLRTVRALKIETDDNEARIGYAGRTAQIARVHQEGLADRVTPSGPLYVYPARRLLGLTADDRRVLAEELLSRFR